MIVGLQLLIDLDESALSDLNLRFFESRDFGIRLAAHGHEYSIEKLLSFFDVFSFKGGTNAIPFILDRSHRGVEPNRFEHLLQTLMQRQAQVTICSGSQSRKHLHYGNARAQRGVDRA